MEPYANCHTVQQLSIPERVDAFRRSTLHALGKELTIEQVLDATELMLENEQYELVQGVQQAVAEFRANPQLRLF